MKAIIMAGGQGTRLRPLTCDCPKPMLPLMGRPLMTYAVDLLRRHGITEIAATLGYLPDAVTEYFGDQLRYYIEKTPLGTAGSVRQAESFLDERFIVLSGDGVADFDLTEAVRFHKSRRALATLILKSCGDPQEYGVVCADPDGRIKSFHEKPGRCDVISDLVNTGAYILEPEILRRIPSHAPYDFGHDLFPSMVAEGLPVYGWTTDGYWCDVGDVGAYLAVHRDALEGRIRLSGLERAADGVHIASDAIIEDGASVTDFSVVGADCRIEAGASVKRSVLMNGAQVRSGAQLRGCVVCKGAIVGEGAQLYEESVLGAHSEMGRRAVLRAGVKLWPEKVLSGGQQPRQNVVWGGNPHPRFINGAITVNSPAQCSVAAAACAAQLRPREVLLGHGGSSVAAAMGYAAASGLMAQGAQVIDAGSCPIGQLRHTQRSLRADAAMFVSDDSLRILNAYGADLTEQTRRGILQMTERQDFAAPFSAITHPTESVGETILPYVASLAARFNGQSPRNLCICCGNTQVLSIAERVFERVGFHVRGEWNAESLASESVEDALCLSDTGEACTFAGFDETECQLMRAWTALESGERRLLLPPDATHAIEVLCARYDGECETVFGERSVWMNALAKRAPVQFDLQFDGIACAVAFLSTLNTRRLTIREWRSCIPRAMRVSRDLEIPEARCGELLGALARDVPDTKSGGGMRMVNENGWAWFAPNEAADSFRLTAEAHSMEAAQELFDFYAGKIGKILHKRSDKTVPHK